MTEAFLCPGCFAEGYGGHCMQCGYSDINQRINPVILVPGTVLKERYYMGRLLGAGGFGITYLAKDMETGERVALKEYLPSTLAIRDPDTLDVYAASTESQQIFLHGRDMFLKEAEILRLFRGHELMVQVMDSFTLHGTAYFVMEYLDGINVKQLMKSRGGIIPCQMVEEIMRQTGEALQAVHQKGLLHRDISPENIIITLEGNMKLIDFGATRFYMGEKSRNLSVIIKPGFAPPEQYSSKGNQGAWTDIYALCATLWHMLSGLTVPDAPSRIDGAALPVLPKNVIRDCPKLPGVLKKGLELDYRSRFQSVEEMLAACRDTQTPASSSAAAPGVVQHRIKGKPYMQLYQNGREKDRWTLPGQMQMAIGRSSDKCNVIIDDPNISRIHCTITYDTKTGEFYLLDQSSNGTYLGGERLTENRIYTLSPESVFELIPGRIALKVGVE